MAVRVHCGCGDGSARGVVVMVVMPTIKGTAATRLGLLNLRALFAS